MLMLTVTAIPAFKDNYIWLLTNPAIGNAAVVVDPGDAKPVLDTLSQQQLQLTAILITHHHADHIGGISQILQHHPVPVYGPVSQAIPAISHPLQNQNDVQLAALPANLQALTVPGHTLDHIAYYGHGSLFCGDTLFAGGCGRVFEGTMQQMHESLMKLAVLPDDTLIYCAHEYTLANLKFALAVEPHNLILQKRFEKVSHLRQLGHATIPVRLELEKQTNPFLRTVQPAVIKAAEQFTGEPLPTAWQVFESLRLWKNNF